MAGNNSTIIKAGAVATAGALALASGLITKWEGVRYSAYLDPIGIPTVCYGHTRDVSMTRKYTLAECNRLLRNDMLEADAIVRKCLPVPMNQNQRAALISATFNIGPKVVCGSTLRKRALEGDWTGWTGACAQLDRWKYAGNRVFRGLVLRRADERAVCEGRVPLP